MGTNLGAGLQLTIYGMGLVFLLLTILWGLIALLGRLDRGAPPAEPAASLEPTAAHVAADAMPAQAAADGRPSPELLAAISVAVLTHRAIRRRRAAPAMRSHPPGSLPSRWLALGRGQQTAGWQPRRR